MTTNDEVLCLAFTAGAAGENMAANYKTSCELSKKWLFREATFSHKSVRRIEILLGKLA